MGETLLIADASTLLNFLRVRRFDLIQALGMRVRIVDAVFEEIRSEREQLEELLESGSIRTLTLEGIAITERVTGLLALGLGSGEAFTFAAAMEFDGAVAIDDRRAVKRLGAASHSVQILTSSDIVLAGIRADLLTVSEADELKDEWATNHQFRLRFESFAQLIEVDR